MSTKRVQGKVIVAGYDWTIRLRLDSETASFPEGSTYVAQVRRAPHVSEVLATMSSADGTIDRVDGNTLDLTLRGSDSEGWPERKAYIDIVRTDIDPPQHLGFRLTVPVKLPITRL